MAIHTRRQCDVLTRRRTQPKLVRPPHVHCATTKAKLGHEETRTNDHRHPPDAWPVPRFPRRLKPRVPSGRTMDRYELRRLDYSLSEDHQAIQEAYKQFFKTHCSIETVRAAEESGFDKSLWERLCAMGATTMALPEAVGGDGATLVDLTLVAEEIGRSLAPVPWIDHVCAARLLARLGALDSDLVKRQAAGRPRSSARQCVRGSADPDGLDRRPDRRPRRRQGRPADVRHPSGQGGQHRQAADGLGGSRRRRQPHRGRQRRRCPRGIPAGAG